MRPDLVDHRRASLGRYVPWIARDYFTNQGPATALVLLLIGALTVQAAGGPEGFRALPETMAGRVVQSALGTLVFLGTFFATNGIIANDRKFSYYRFLFSKPVNPLGYYATVFATYGVGLLLVTAVLLGVWAWLVRPMFSVELFAVVALMYLAYGGIGFLLSAAWRFDWISLVTVLFVSNVLWSIWGRQDGVKKWIVHLLPPVHRTDELYATVGASEAGVPWTLVAWLGGYGLGAFLMGLVVLRRRSMATS